jgi:acetyltransferase-like isoleucine patch superfamily enzyme
VNKTTSLPDGRASPRCARASVSPSLRARDRRDVVARWQGIAWVRTRKFIPISVRSRSAQRCCPSSVYRLGAHAQVYPHRCALAIGATLLPDGKASLGAHAQVYPHLCALAIGTTLLPDGRASPGCARASVSRRCALAIGATLLPVVRLLSGCARASVSISLRHQCRIQPTPFQQTAVYIYTIRNLLLIMFAHCSNDGICDR